jgi:Fur family ferric uptake transcriptional regulator
LANARDDYSLGTVRVSLTPLERFREFLDSRGKRLTQQRQIVLDKIFESHDHFEADELVESIAYGESDVRVSRPTVYRTLNELVASGLLRKLSVGGRSVYEHDYGYPQHDHLYCEKCQKLIEFQSEELKKLRTAVAAQNQFQVRGHRLVINGICHDCRSRRKKRPVDQI